MSPGSSVVYGPFYTVSSTVTSVSFRTMCLHAFPMQLSGIFWIGMDFVVALALMTIGDFDRQFARPRSDNWGLSQNAFGRPASLSILLAKCLDIIFSGTVKVRALTGLYQMS